MRLSARSHFSSCPRRIVPPRHFSSHASRTCSIERLQRRCWVRATSEEKPKVESASAAAPNEEPKVESADVAAAPKEPEEASPEAGSPEAAAEAEPVVQETKTPQYIDEMKPIERTPLSANMKDKMRKEYLDIGGAENVAMGKNWFLIIFVAIAVLAIASKLTGAI